MRKSVLVILLLATACAETYGPAGSFSRTFMGGGYRDRQIDQQTWEVEYSGANFNSGLVNKWALRRAAEVARREGFPYFSVAGAGRDNVGNYAGDKYVGASVFVRLQVRGWRSYEERCKSGKVVQTTINCDLYDTQRTLANAP